MYEAYNNAADFQRGVRAAEAAKVKRGNQTIESLSLMDRNPKVEGEIIKRIKARDAAREGVRDAHNAYNEALRQSKLYNADSWKYQQNARNFTSAADDALFDVIMAAPGVTVGHWVPDLIRTTQE